MSSPEIVLSLNEILFYFTRAAVGVGSPYGIAEDFARSSIWLGICGFDPVKKVLPALKSLDEGKSGIKVFQKDDTNKTVLSSLEKKRLSALQGGVVICDCISTFSKKSYQFHKFVVENVDCPLLIAATIGNHNLGSWRVSWEGTNSNIFSVLIFDNGNCITSWTEKKIAEKFSPSDVFIEQIELNSINKNNLKNLKNFSNNRKKVLEKGIPIYSDWKNLHHYFSRVLVSSDENSRISGAGAGLIDMD